MMDVRLRATGKTIPPEQRAKLREKGLKELAEDGSGPLPLPGKRSARR